jgi:hypothetical protein
MVQKIDYRCRASNLENQEIFIIINIIRNIRLRHYLLIKKSYQNRLLLFIIFEVRFLFSNQIFRPYLEQKCGQQDFIHQCSLHIFGLGQNMKFIFKLTKVFDLVVCSFTD